ncbi:glutathione S-transferase family protein [Taklimakanibacter deserti]|uniref:glutathione S-transferase family protein n=1 Tax=Taklimakanibacter deserti TaxID=2267839 RepID=UPI000E64AAD5
MKIYGVPLSVHTRKVIVAARLKGIPFELETVIPVIPGNPPSNWREISPTGLIPAIEDQGFRLADSTAIVAYLERKHPTPALLPADDREYGAALSLDAWAGSELFRGVIHPLFHNQIVAPKIRNVQGNQVMIDAAKNKAAPEAFAYLESLDPEGYLVGGKLTIADIAVVSNLILFNYLGYRIEPRFPKLNAYFRRHLEEPALSGALGDEKPFVDQMGLDRSFLQ